MAASEDTPKITPSQIVLCFDGTGNTFRADGTETNVLRICRMVARSDHQPGIGTEITAGSLAATTLKKSSRLGKSKTLSQALGKSFDKHVLGGYRFLMRHCRSDSHIYIFGFSRGAYTARFLAEMLDYTGLLGPDNEEMIPFIWEAFSRWKLARFNNTSEKRRAFDFMRQCRETLCRPVQQVKFLGLFDTVNSVADFEINNIITSTAQVTRHAVSIDERRVKFQPVLLGENLKNRGKGKKPYEHTTLTEKQKEEASVLPGECVSHPAPTGETSTTKSSRDDDSEHVDLLEVWFPGGHADIGGGFQKVEGEQWQLSHAPLVWMVQEARRAGLDFDEKKLHQFKCIEDDAPTDGCDPDEGEMRFVPALLRSSEAGRLHDRLQFGQGFSVPSVLVWRLMEYIPIRRAELQQDGRWALIRWKLHRGRVRDIPLDAWIHVSAIRRMKADKNYRPGNLIIGGGGRGIRRAPEEVGIGEWVVDTHAEDPVRELYVRKLARHMRDLVARVD
ncbi:hypothetical protein ATERTT37_005907 [Aspergillus terreus]